IRRARRSGCSGVRLFRGDVDCPLRQLSLCRLSPARQRYSTGETIWMHSEDGIPYLKDSGSGVPKYDICIREIGEALSRRFVLRALSTIGVAAMGVRPTDRKQGTVMDRRSIWYVALTCLGAAVGCSGGSPDVSSAVSLDTGEPPPVPTPA